MSEAQPFSYLVVVGSSAGGIEALSELVSTLPEDLPAPVVVAQHLDPDRESRLREILEQRSTLPVKTLTEHTSLPLESGMVFVVPADRHVHMTSSEIFLHEDTKGRPKPSIDLIFSSAAEMYGDRLIAVVLTGTGHDGTDGARAVKKAGGTVIIQNPQTAKHPDMPRSLAPNTVDVVVDLEKIGPALHKLLAGIEVPSKPDEKQKVESFLEELRNVSGIDFRSYKTPTIMRRLQRRIVATDSVDLDGYREYLKNHPDEYQHLVNSFLIKVTEFFRDRELFEFLREELIPELIQNAKTEDNQLRIWSAGCATGEEAYSLAMLVCEALDGDSEHFNVRILGTDVDEEAIDFARRGIYSEAALSGLPEEFVDRYLIKEDDAYQVRKRVRSMIVFGQHDLAQRAPFPRTDLVLCRNVLIYFTTELQKRALQLFAYSLKDGGYLLLGKSETASPLGEYFAPYNKEHRLYRRRGERFLMSPLSTTTPTPVPKVRGESYMRPPAVPALAQESQEEKMRETLGAGSNFLLHFPVGLVEIDRKYDIRSINHAARRLLAISDPAVGEDFLHMVQGAHYTELRAAIDTAFREGQIAEVGRFDIEEVTTGETRYLRVICHPQRAADEDLASSVMVIVSDVTDLVQAQLRLEERLETVEAELERTRREAQEDRERQETLNKRLLETNRQLTEANQELTSINEELQATNEQYLVSNEETQAASEEVETLNEELQATNEELETLNEELQATIEELNTTNEDLQARSLELQEYAGKSEEEQANVRSLLESLPDAVIAVEAHGEVRFANEVFEQMFGTMQEGETAPRNFTPRDEDGRTLPPSQTPQVRAARGESFSMRFTADTADGAGRRFEATGQPLRHGGRQGGVIVIREVTG